MNPNNELELLKVLDEKFLRANEKYWRLRYNTFPSKLAGFGNIWMR